MAADTHATPATLTHTGLFGARDTVGGATSEQLAELAWLASHAAYKKTNHEVSLALPSGIEGVHVAGIGHEAPIVFLRARWRNWAVLAFRGTDPSAWSDVRADMDKTIKCWHVPTDPDAEVTACPNCNDSRGLGRCEHNHRTAFHTGPGEYNCVAVHGGFRRRAHKCPFLIPDLLSTRSTAHDYGEGGTAPTHLLVTGHSLGGGAAVAYTYEALLRSEITVDKVACVTFAAPMTIDKEGVQVAEVRGMTAAFTNFVNTGDPIPFVSKVVDKTLPCRFDEFGYYLTGLPTDRGGYTPVPPGKTALRQVDGVAHFATKVLAATTAHSMSTYCPTPRLADAVTSFGAWVKEGVKAAVMSKVAWVLAPTAIVSSLASKDAVRAAFTFAGAAAEGPGNDGKGRAHDYDDPTSHVPGVFHVPTWAIDWTGAAPRRRTHDPTTSVGMPAGSSDARDSEVKATAILATLHREGPSGARQYYLEGDADRPDDYKDVVRAWLVVVEDPACKFRIGQVVASDGPRKGTVVGARPASLPHSEAAAAAGKTRTRFPAVLTSLGMPAGDATLTAMTTALWRQHGGREYFLGNAKDKPESATECVTAWLVVVDAGDKCKFNKGDVVAKGGPRHGTVVGKLSGHVPLVATPRAEADEDGGAAGAGAGSGAGAGAGAGSADTFAYTSGGGESSDTPPALATAPGPVAVAPPPTPALGAPIAPARPAPTGPQLARKPHAMPPPDQAVGLPSGYTMKTAATTELLRAPGGHHYYFPSDENVPAAATERVTAWLIVVESSKCAYRKGQVVAKGGARHATVVGTLAP